MNWRIKMNKFKITDTKDKADSYIYLSNDRFTYKDGKDYNDQTIKTFCSAMLKHGVLECTIDTNNNQVKLEFYY